MILLIINNPCEINIENIAIEEVHLSVCVRVTVLARIFARGLFLHLTELKMFVAKFAFFNIFPYTNNL